MAVDVVVFTVADGQVHTLLARIRRGALTGRWAFPGGFVGLAESPDAAARRELCEHAGIGALRLEQLYTFGTPRRDPGSRVVSVAYLGLSRHHRTPRASAKYAEVAWCPLARVPALAYDHARVLRTAVARLRAKLEYTNVVCELMPATFTLGELQEAYEAILGRRLDRRNFRRKLLALGLLLRAPGLRRGHHRPAALYRFRVRRPMIIRML